MGLKSFLARQASHPSGWFGRVITSWILNKANASLEDMGLELMDIQENEYILEIGFGNGRMISNIASKLTDGKVYGIEISEDMIRVDERKNRHLIQEGKVHIQNASVEDIPFGDDSFDNVFTANTIYFWPHAEKDIQEVRRVLKEGGTFYCAMRPKEEMIKRNLIRENLDTFQNLYSVDEMKEFLSKSGFKNVKSHLREGKAFPNLIVEGTK